MDSSAQQDDWLARILLLPLPNESGAVPPPAPLSRSLMDKRIDSSTSFGLEIDAPNIQVAVGPGSAVCLSSSSSSASAAAPLELLPDYNGRSSTIEDDFDQLLGSPSAARPSQLFSGLDPSTVLANIAATVVQVGNTTLSTHISAASKVSAHESPLILLSSLTPEISDPVRAPLPPPPELAQSKSRHVQNSNATAPTILPIKPSPAPEVEFQNGVAKDESAKTNVMPVPVPKPEHWPAIIKVTASPRPSTEPPSEFKPTSVKSKESTSSSDSDTSSPSQEEQLRAKCRLPRWANDLLEQRFAECTHLSAERARAIGDEMGGVPQKRIQDWFYNKKKRLRSIDTPLPPCNRNRCIRIETSTLQPGLSSPHPMSRKRKRQQLEPDLVEPSYYTPSPPPQFSIMRPGNGSSASLCPPVSHSAQTSNMPIFLAPGSMGLAPGQYMLVPMLVPVLMVPSEDSGSMTEATWSGSCTDETHDKENVLE